MAGDTAPDQERDEAEAAPAEPWEPSEFSRKERFEVRGVHGADAHPHPHEPLVQVTIDAEQKLEEKGRTNPGADGGPGNASEHR
jgi:hypothetical protein